MRKHYSPALVGVYYCKYRTSCTVGSGGRARNGTVQEYRCPEVLRRRIRVCGNTMFASDPPITTTVHPCTAATNAFLASLVGRMVHSWGVWQADISVFFSSSSERQVQEVWALLMELPQGKSSEFRTKNHMCVRTYSYSLMKIESDVIISNVKRRWMSFFRALACKLIRRTRRLDLVPRHSICQLQLVLPSVASNLTSKTRIPNRTAMIQYMCICFNVLHAT